jgi:hypothetical protein
VKFLQAILFRHDESAVFGPAIWAALEEVAGLFSNYGPHKSQYDEYERLYLAKCAPDSIPTRSRFDAEAFEEQFNDAFWTSKEARGAYMGTYDLGPLVERVREVMGDPGRSLPLVLVTDVELTPIPRAMNPDDERNPAGGQDSLNLQRRYIFAGRFRTNSYLLSIRRMDPARWWGKPDPNPDPQSEATKTRIATVKRRVRAAACQATAVLIYENTKRCFNNYCYLYVPDQDPSVLDDMEYFCDEHGKFDLRLISAVQSASSIPAEGKNLVVVAAVDQVLHFRILDGDGKMVVDTDERRLTERVRPIEDLKDELKDLWPPHELTEGEKGRVIASVTSIIDHNQRGLGDLEYRGFRAESDAPERIQESTQFPKPAITEN